MCDEQIIKLEPISALARLVPLRNPVHLLTAYLMSQMAFGKQSNDTAVDSLWSSFLKAFACLVGREEQHSIGGADRLGE